MRAISVDDQQSRNPPIAEENAVIEAAQANPSAFAPLYERYLDRIYAYLRVRTSSAEEAADLTQQVFLRALAALPGYRGAESGFAAWLFRIARNTATDAHRRRRDTVTWDYVPESMHPRSEHTPETLLEHAEALARLRSLVATLDVDTRELLALRFAARLTVAQIATIIGASEAATHKRLLRALQSLKEHYHDSTR